MAANQEQLEEPRLIDIVIQEATKGKGNKALQPILNYDSFQELGRGGFGVVYKAREKESKQIVAIKVMQTSVVLSSTRGQEEETTFKRFKREISLLKRLKELQNNHIVEYYDDDAVCEVTGLCFLVMEYCDGGSVADLVEKNQGKILSTEDCLDIIIQALDGLICLHDKKGIHRDIKPENILLNYNNNQEQEASRIIAKLCDFGLAKALDISGLTSSSSITQINIVKTDEDPKKILNQFPVSYPFTSRNLIRDWKNATPKTDVWSMAATLYYMLTGGKYPRDFSNISNELDIIEVIRKSKPISIQDRNVAIPDELVTIIDNALNEYENHYSTATEFKQDLIRFIELPNNK
jgi:serine/threonine protein kinase